MKLLYIGHYNEGSTSRMRGEYLRQLLPETAFTIINIDVPLAATPRLLRSFGWRFKRGPLIQTITDHINSSLKGDFKYDIVWIDKGVFIEPQIIRTLRANSTVLVHYTPDPAFAYQRSRLFYEALPLYDFCVTTKSFELKDYARYGVKTIFCTQGFDPNLHRPYHDFEQKNGVVFIGHKEEDREFVIAKLVEMDIPVTIAGNHWEVFSRKRKGKKNLTYLGKGVFGEQYAKELSQAQIGLGFLSRWIPELHTTRTFEIPACKTALLTERNPEIESIFNGDEVYFFDDVAEVPAMVEEKLSDSSDLRSRSEKGYRKVTNGQYSYFNILKKVLATVHE